jgi:hypothetical protein
LNEIFSPVVGIFHQVDRITILRYSARVSLSSGR